MTTSSGRKAVKGIDEWHSGWKTERVYEPAVSVGAGVYTGPCRPKGKTGHSVYVPVLLSPIGLNTPSLYHTNPP